MNGPCGPAMSVILVTPDCIETLRRTLKHLGAQSARDRLEIVIVSPAGVEPNVGDMDFGVFAGIQLVHLHEMHSTAAGRAAGIRNANAPLVVFVEDHSFPDADWAAELICAHRQPWAAIGPVIGNANPGSLISWANLFIEYGEWLDNCSVQPVRHLPGHNSSYKRSILLDYGETLETMLQAESVLHWDLRRRGFKIALERKALTRHLNFSRLAPSMRMRFWGAWLFGAARSRSWSFLRRAVYAGGGPLIPLVRSWRILNQMRRYRWKTYDVLRVLPFALFLLAWDASGEIAGYVFGPGRAAKRLVDFEFHRERFLSRNDFTLWERDELVPIK